MTSDFYIVYQVRKHKRQFALKIKKIIKRCYVVKVTASLVTFGASNYRKEIKLKNSNLTGSIFLNVIQLNSRISLEFQTYTVGLFDCYDQVKIGEESTLNFSNPLDITDVVEKSCQPVTLYIYFLSNKEIQKRKQFTVPPSLLPLPDTSVITASVDHALE